jgi:hypothetical protein
MEAANPPKRRYSTTELHGTTTQKMEAARTSETSISYHKTAGVTT